MTMMNTILKIARLFGAAVVTVVALVASTEAEAICIQTGGEVICHGLVAKTSWSHGLCDDAGPYLYRIKAWCTVNGGTWNNTNGTCENEQAQPPLGLAGGAGLFVSLIHPGESCSGAGEPGTCLPGNCNCQDGYVGSIQIRNWQQMNFAGATLDGQGLCSPWAERIIIEGTRQADCPPGMTVGIGGDETTPCVKWPPCKTCVGNPVDVGNGDKLQREVDYASPGPGGLVFERLYNSGGFFSATPREDMVVTDFWRHTYSTRVHPYTGNAYVMAVVQHPDGTPRPFNVSGNEIQNFDGGAHRLEKLVDGSGNITGWKMTTPESDSHLFDASGKLTAVTTRSGFQTTVAYDGSGRVSTVTDAFGRSLTLAYDSNGRMASMTDPSSRVYTYAYDDTGRLISVTYPDTRIRNYLYEVSSLYWALTGIVDERGVRLSTYEYDTYGRAIRTERTGPDNKFSLAFSHGATTATTTATDAFNTGHTYAFTKVKGALRMTGHTNYWLGTESRTYTTGGNPLTFTDRRGTLTTYVYDATRNLETSRTEASGTAQARTITTTWHSTLRLPATITGPSGVSGVNLVTEFTYDTAGNLTKKKMTAGTKVQEWNYTVNSLGQVLAIDGPRTDVTDVTTMTYYSASDTCLGCRGQVYTATNAAGQVTTFNNYNLDGRPTQVTDANGVSTALTYTTRGWLATRSTASETTSYDYDYVGNLTKVTLPDGSWVSYQYDDASALVGVDDSAGNATDYELDVMGNRVSEAVFDAADGLRRTLQRVYDGANRLQRDLGAQAQTTQYTYDANRNLLTATDPLNRVITNTYDALNRLTNIKDAANGNTVFTYDAKDRLATVKDPKLSATTTYTYDGLGNLLTQVSPDTGTTTFTYDNAGNVATQTDARSAATTYTYDVLNRVTAATVTDGTVTYEYDNTTTGGSYALGRMTKVTDPSGNTTYVYDSLGRVTSKVQTVTASPADKTFTLGYSHASGRQTGITYPSGRAVTYGFDANGRIASISVDSSSVLTSGEYFPFGGVRKWVWANGQVYERTFDRDGRVQSLTLGPDTTTYGDLSQVFGYDSLNRLVSANLASGQTQSFTYDANSNRTNGTINAASTTYTYPSTSHKLTSLSGATSRSFTYDNAGNVTVSAGITYVYDGRGRMKQAGSTTYLINGLGQRVKKAGAGETYFAYDESGHLIGEYDSTGATIQETVWLGDTPVAVVKPATPSGFTVYNVWTDLLDTPRMITDTANNSRWEWAHNDPFGNNAPNENPASLGAFAFNLRYPGQYFDVETGLSYNWMRDYDPRIGRYIQSDPIGLAGGLNTFGYVDGNPLTGFDPTGEANSGGGHRSGKWKDCGGGCRIRIDHSHQGVGRHLHWECRGSSGVMGEYGSTSHGQNSGSAPGRVKDCARKHGFEPDPQPGGNSQMCGDTCKTILGGTVVACGVAFCVLQPQLCALGAAGYALSR